MKIIPKFQQGGEFANRFTTYAAIQGLSSIFGHQDSSSSRRETGKEDDYDKGKLTEKDFANLIKDLNGLPSDVDYVTNLATSLWRRSSFNSGSDDSFNSNSLITHYARVSKGLAQIQHNKQLYDEAYENLRKTGGLNEIAIMGEDIVVSDSNGNLTTVSPDEYLQNKSKYQTMTNSNVLYLRAYKKEYANDAYLIKVAGSGIGMEEVTKQIQSRIGSIGTDTQQQSGYVVKSQDKVLKGLELIEDKLAKEVIDQKGMTLDGVYKMKSLTKTQKDQISIALEYIYQTLTPEAQTLLRVKSGNAQNSVKGAKNFILAKLTAQSSTTIESDVEYQDKWDENAVRRDPNSKQSKEDELKENVALQFLRGRGERSTVNLIPGDNLGFKVNATTMILTGDSSFKGNFLDEVRNSDFGGILDLTNATMGNGRKITIPNQVEILDNHVRLVLFPTKDGVTPDFSLKSVEAKRQADEELKQRNIDVENEESFNEHYAEINDTYAKYGMANGNQLKYFAVINGRTNNKALGMEDMFADDNYLESVSEDERKEYKRKWSEEHSKGNNKQKLDLDDYSSLNPFDWGGNYDEVYDGLIWIPVMQNWALAQAGTREKVKPSIANKEDLNEYISQQEERAARSYVKPDDFE